MGSDALKTEQDEQEERDSLHAREVVSEDVMKEAMEKQNASLGQVDPTMAVI